MIGVFLEDAPLALAQPFDIDAVLLAEARDLLVLQRQRRLDLLVGKIAGCGNIPDAPAYDLFELSSPRHRFAIVAPHWMRGEKRQVVGDGAFDPLGFHAGVLMLAPG